MICCESYHETSKRIGAPALYSQYTQGIRAMKEQGQMPTMQTSVQAVATFTPWRIVVDTYLAGGIDSDHTRRAYRRHIEHAIAALGSPALAELNGTRLATYRSQVTGSGLSPASQGQALSATRAFLAWGRRYGCPSSAC
jgi:hypothetical protein